MMSVASKLTLSCWPILCRSEISFKLFQICLGLANGVVKTFDVGKNEFVSEQDFSIGEGKFKGLFKWNE